MFKIKRIIPLTLVIAILVSAGIVAAQDDSPDQRPPDGPRSGPIRDRVQGTLIEAIEAEIGLAPREILQQAITEDLNFAEVITANEGDVEAVIATVITQVEDRLAEAIANDRITPEQAEERLEQIESGITDLLNNRPPEHRGDRRPGQRFNLDGALRDALEDAGITREEVRTARENGQTIPELLVENGVDLAQLEADLTAQLEDRLSQAVEDGKMSPERAEDLLARFTERLSEFLSDTP